MTEMQTGVPAEELRAAARLYAQGGNGAIYYGLGVTEHSQGSTTVMGIANLAMLTGNIGRDGVGVNPLRGQNNVQGSCDMGSFPHELPGYRHVKNADVRAIFENAWGVEIDPEPGLRIPNMLDAAVAGTFKGLYCQGEDILQSDPDTKHVAAGLAAMECVIVHDLFLNETANYAHVFLPGSTFLEKDGTFTNAERRINRVRKVMAPRNGYADWEITQMLARAMGADWHYTHPAQIMEEIAATTPVFRGRHLRSAGRGRIGPVALQRGEARGLAHHACGRLRARQGAAHDHRIRGDGRKDRPAFPAAADHGAYPQPVQCRRADAADGKQRLA
jgi:formate dehydrogenase major subunit